MTFYAKLHEVTAHDRAWLLNAPVIRDCFEQRVGLETYRAFQINCEAPILLCKKLLPHLPGQRAARVLNIGPTFGSIGFPGYAAYSASKFAMRGFTEALRREMSDSSVTFHYLAPRATRTGINSSAVYAMNEEMHMAMDTPDEVAEAAVAFLASGKRDKYLGWPEKLFVRINGLLPRIVDRALGKQLPIVRRYASRKTDMHAAETPRAASAWTEHNEELS